MAYVIEPIALLCWTAWRIISSIDQHVYWVLLVIICALFVSYQLLPGKKAASQSLYTDKQGSLNRFDHWQKTISDSAAGGEKADQLRDCLKELAGDMIAQMEQSRPVDMDELAAESRELLPVAVHWYLFLSEQEKGSIQEKMIDFTPERVRVWMSKFRKRDYSAIEATLSWMENELEIKYGK
jgi:hypothetical protein